MNAPLMSATDHDALSTQDLRECSRMATSPDASVLPQIYGDKVNIAIWQRTHSLSFSRAIENFLAAHPSYALSLMTSPASVHESVSAALPSDSGGVLADDIAELVHAFVDVRIRIMLWKLFTNKLYAGEHAQAYLTDARKLPEYRDNYKYCPICTGNITATYEHLFWDCPSVTAYWNIVLSICTGMGFTSPIQSYSDFITFIDRDHCNDIQSVFKDEIMFNSIYTIYCVTIDLMKIVNSQMEDRDDKWQFYIDNYLYKLLTKLNKFNKDSAYNLPYQNRAVIDQVAYEHQVGLAKNVLLKQQTLRPSLTLNRKELSTDMVEIYEKTWASGNILGYIHNHQYFYLPIVTSHLDPHPR